MKKLIKQLTNKSSDWSFDAGTDGTTVSDEKLTISCLMRIADALEVMSNPYVELLRKVEFEQNSRRFLTEQNKNLRNKIAGHKAAFTKLKNKQTD